MKSIQLKNINKAYNDGGSIFTVLNDLNLSVDKGEFVAIVGPSGSGKSTLLSIAGLLLKQDSGSIEFEGKALPSLSKRSANAIRGNHLGFIFQTHHLLPYLRGFDQIDMVVNTNTYTTKTEKKEAIESLFENLGITECMHKYPKHMSGGQRQRVAIARAFINKPSLILADEPTASLDAERGRQVVSMIRQEVKRNQTSAIMVTHDERILDLVDTVYRIQDGQLIKQELK